MENNSFYLDIMAAKARYAESNNYTGFVNRMNRIVDSMYRFKNDPDIAMLITQVDRLLEDESIRNYVQYKYDFDRELHLDIFKDETLCEHDEQEKLNGYFKQDKFVKKDVLTDMVVDYFVGGIDSVCDKLVPQVVKKSRPEYRFEVYRLDSDEFVGEFGRTKEIVEALGITINIVNSAIFGTKGINKKHNFKIIRSVV